MEGWDKSTWLVVVGDTVLSVTTAAERARQLALVSRLKTIYPEVPEWPTPDEITHEHWLAYMKTPHDVGGELTSLTSTRTRKKSNGN